MILINYIFWAYGFDQWVMSLFFIFWACGMFWWLILLIFASGVLRIYMILGDLCDELIDLKIETLAGCLLYDTFVYLIFSSNSDTNYLLFVMVM